MILKEESYLFFCRNSIFGAETTIIPPLNNNLKKLKTTRYEYTNK
jgi:hypothetical protein